MSKSISADFELIPKLARLAFDVAATEGEAQAAAIKTVEITRKTGLGSQGFRAALARTQAHK